MGEGLGGEGLNATENGNRENGARLALANPARGLELFPAAARTAFTGDNNRRHSTRNARGNARDSATAG